MTIKKRKRFIVSLPLAVFGLVLVGAACPKQVEMQAAPQEGAVIQKVTVGSEKVTVNTSEKAKATAFVRHDPLRVTVQMENVRIGEGVDREYQGKGIISKVELQVREQMEPPVVHLVAYVDGQVSHQLSIKGKKLVLQLSEAGGMTPSEKMEQPPQPEIPYEETMQELERMLSGEPPAERPAEAAPMRTVTPAVSEVEQAPPRFHPILPPMPPSNPDGTANTLGEILYRTTDDGFQVMLMTNGPLADFLDFEMLSPPKLVIDLWRVQASTPKKLYPVKWGGIKQVRVGSHHDKARVVIDFTSRLAAYDVRSTATGIVVTIFKNRPYVPGGIKALEYVTGPNDTLRQIARKQYGNGDDWPRILAANRKVFTREEMENVRKANGNMAVGEKITLRIPVR